MTRESDTEYGAPLGTAPDGAKYNQVIDGHLYWYQQEWSNQSQQCLQRLSLGGEEPTATFTSAPVAGNEVSFDASGSTAPGGIATYSWQFNDGVGSGTPVQTTTPSISHSFPAAGVYTVALTVLANDGTSIGAARTLTVGAPPAPSIAKLSKKSAPAIGGTLVTISGTGFTGVTSVKFGSVSTAG